MYDEIMKADVLQARKMIARLSEIEPDIAIALACGVDCREESDRCKHMKEFLMRFNELRGHLVSQRMS